MREQKEKELGLMLFIIFLLQVVPGFSLGIQKWYNHLQMKKKNMFQGEEGKNWKEIRMLLEKNKKEI
jgi:hypothetical protein